MAFIIEARYLGDYNESHARYAKCNRQVQGSERSDNQSKHSTFGFAAGIVSRERIQYEALITGQKVGVMRVDWE